MCPREINSWFMAGELSPGGGRWRQDDYLLDPLQTELGIKKRGQKPGVEIKGLVETLHHNLDPNSHISPIEIWCKWNSGSLSIDRCPTLQVQKLRRLRRFDGTSGRFIEIPLDENENARSGRSMPGRGFNVELTEIKVGRREEIWWTFGVEAFGDLEFAEGCVRFVQGELASIAKEVFQSARWLSYPAWLSETFTAGIATRRVS